MSSYWELYLHVVWGTKDRSHILRGDGEIAVHRAIRDTARELQLVPICVNSAWNHTHSLLSWNLDSCVRDVVDTLKTSAIDAWDEVRSKSQGDMPALEWQNGFSAFTLSRGQVKKTKKYVAQQKDNHRNGDTWSHFEKWCTLEPSPKEDDTETPEPEPRSNSQPQNL